MGLCYVAHELGHYLVAKYFKVKISFFFYKWRLVWTISGYTKAQKIYIALAGFGFEFLYAILMLAIFGFHTPLLFAFIHLLTYNYTAGNKYNDFKLLTS